MQKNNWVCYGELLTARGLQWLTKLLSKKSKSGKSD
jgi:hypothetical protein